MQFHHQWLEGRATKKEPAGAMIFIVVEEVIPESQSGGNTDLATMGLIAGFIVMMILDVSLG